MITSTYPWRNCLCILSFKITILSHGKENACIGKIFFLHRYHVHELAATHPSFLWEGDLIFFNPKSLRVLAESTSMVLAVTFILGMVQNPLPWEEPGIDCMAPVILHIMFYIPISKLFFLFQLLFHDLH